MRRGWWLLAAVFLSASAVADELQCLRYDTEAFVASKRWIPPGKTLSPEDVAGPVEAVYLLKLPSLTKRNFYNMVSVVVKAGGKIYRNDYLECAWENGAYYCRGECDSGQVWLDRRNRMRLAFVSYSKEGREGPELLLELYPKVQNRWMKGVQVACPREMKQGSYVCYGKKEKGKYFFCHRSREACDAAGEHRFGHYPDESAVRAALMRCSMSTPREQQPTSPAR